MADNWEAKLEEQRQRADALAPSSEQVAKLKAMVRLNQIREQAMGVGANLRLAQPQVGVSDILKYYSAMDVPTRSTTVTLPGLKQAGVFDYLSRPIVDSIRMRAAEAARMADEELTKAPTDDPESLRWYQPLQIMAHGKGVTEGWHRANETEAAKQRAEMEQKVEAAKKMFDEALQSEYRGRNKSASANEVIDQLADSHVKQGFADLNSLIQLYATGGTLLGAGAHQAAKDYVKDTDPREMKLRAIKEVLHQRIRQRPPVVHVSVPEPDSQDVTDAETATKI
jgi:hypothetical protein